MCTLSGKKPVGRPSCRWVDDKERDARDLGLEGTDYRQNGEGWLSWLQALKPDVASERVTVKENIKQHLDFFTKI